jgi:hypothetical protein
VTERRGPIIVRIVCADHGDRGTIGNVRETRQGAVLDPKGHGRGSAGWSADGRPVSVRDLRALRDRDPADVSPEFQELQRRLREEQVELWGGRRGIPDRDGLVLESVIGHPVEHDGGLSLRCLKCGEKIVPFETLWNAVLAYRRTHEPQPTLKV